jgi:hypothetical protein
MLGFMPFWTQSIITKLGPTRVSEPEVELSSLPCIFSAVSRPRPKAKPPARVSRRQRQIPVAVKLYSAGAGGLVIRA